MNLVASVPGTLRALFAGTLNSRVPATILLAIGGFIPSLTSGLSRFGITETFYLGELLGVVFLFAGFLVSEEVFREFRIPFTHRVLWVRGRAARLPGRLNRGRSWRPRGQPAAAGHPARPAASPRVVVYCRP